MADMSSELMGRLPPLGDRGDGRGRVADGLLGVVGGPAAAAAAEEEAEAMGAAAEASLTPPVASTKMQMMVMSSVRISYCVEGTQGIWSWSSAWC